LRKISHAKTGFSIIVFFFLFSVIFILSVANKPHPAQPSRAAQLLNTGWFYYNSEGASVPVVLPCRLPAPAAAGAVVRIFRTVSPDLAGKRIGFYSKKQTVSVYVGKSVIYDWNKPGAPSWIKTYGWLFHRVYLPSFSAGQTLCIELTAEVPDGAGQVSQMYAGSGWGIDHAVFAAHATQAFVSCMMILLGIVFFLVYFLFHKIFLPDRTGFLLGLISVMTGLWQLEESTVLYLFCSNPAVHWIFDYLLFLLLSVLIVPLAEEITDRRQSPGFTVLFELALCVVVVECVFQFTGIRAFTEMLIPVQIVIFLTCLYSLFVFCIEIRKRKIYQKPLYVSAIFLISGMIIEIFMYYFHVVHTGIILQISLIQFFICFGVYTYRLAVREFRKAQAADRYYSLAFTDQLTGVHSRAAFFECCSEEPLDTEYTLYLFDVNNLKEINDTYGHDEGDRLLTFFAGCLSASFSETGFVYRIGGDEFVVLCPHPDHHKLEQCIREYHVRIENLQGVPWKVSAAYGAVSFTAHVRSDFVKARKDADRSMYAMKQQQHRKKTAGKK
jgi:diguanylate cyclase (GGDEF)-like protein